MVDQIAVVTKDITGTGLVNFTDSSLTETFKAAIFIYSKSDSDSTDNTHGVIGFGAIGVDGAIPEEMTMCVQMENGILTRSDNNSMHSGGASPQRCIFSNDGTFPDATVDNVIAVYSATIANGVQLNVTEAAFSVRVTAILFAGLARAATGFSTATTGGVAEAVGDTPNFEPDLLVVLTASSSLSLAEDDACPNIGFAVNRGSTQQVSAIVNFDDNPTTTDSDGARHAAACGMNLSGARASQSLTVAFTSTGYTGTASAGTIPHLYLALKFSGVVRLAAANLDVSGSTGVQTFNGFGFASDLVLGMSTLLSSSNGTLEDGPTSGSMGYFVTGVYGSRAYTVQEEEGVALAATPTNAHERQEDVAVLTYSETTAIAQRATWAGPSTGGGFQLNFSTATVGTLTALGIALGAAETDTEEVSDQATLAVGLALTETEEITDAVVLSGEATIVVGETEEIANSGIIDAGVVDYEQGTPFGWTF